MGRVPVAQDSDTVQWTMPIDRLACSPIPIRLFPGTEDTMARRPGRRPRAAPAEESIFKNEEARAEAKPSPPPKDSPDWPFYSATTKFQKVVAEELETRESEMVHCEMRQTKAREKRIHLLKLTAAKLAKIRKMWDGDPTPDLPVTE